MSLICKYMRQCEVSIQAGDVVSGKHAGIMEKNTGKCVDK